MGITSSTPEAKFVGCVNILMYWRDQVTSLIMGTHQRCGSKSPVSLVALPVLIREWLDAPDQVTTLQLFGDVERNRERSQTSLWVIVKFSKATLGVLGTPLCVMGAELPKEWVVGAKYLFTDSNHKVTVGLGRCSVVNVATREAYPVDGVSYPSKLSCNDRWIVQARFPKDLKIIRIRNGIPGGKLLWVDRGSFSESGASRAIGNPGERPIFFGKDRVLLQTVTHQLYKFAMVNVEETYSTRKIAVLDSMETTLNDDENMQYPFVVCFLAPKVILVQLTGTYHAVDYAPHRGQLQIRTGYPVANTVSAVIQTSYFTACVESEIFALVREEAPTKLEVWSAWNLSAPLYVIPDTEGDGIFRGGELLLVCPTSGDVKLIHGPSGCLLMQIQPTNCKVFILDCF